MISRNQPFVDRYKYWTFLFDLHLRLIMFNLNICGMFLKLFTFFYISFDVILWWPIFLSFLSFHSAKHFSQPWLFKILSNNIKIKLMLKKINLKLLTQIVLFTMKNNCQLSISTLHVEIFFYYILHMRNLNRQNSREAINVIILKNKSTIYTIPVT